MQSQTGTYTSIGKLKQESKIVFNTDMQLYSPEKNGVLRFAHKLQARPSMSNINNELKGFIGSLTINVQNHYRAKLRKFKTEHLIL
jgi:hypothetical protein